jgi:transcriptional regulator GlxA family with amidase domain
MNHFIRQGAMRAVDIIVYPGFKALEAIGALKVFDCANSRLAARAKGDGYQVCIASTQTGMVASDTIMSLHASKKINPLLLPDIAIVVGAHQIEAALLRSPDTVEWVCSATGVSAGIDLALAIVEEDFGHDLALEAARDLGVALTRPGGQALFPVQLAGRRTSHPKVRALQDWILAHLADDLSTPVLAQRLAMSERNLNRVFQRETAHTPAGFIEKARFELARRLLEEYKSPFKLVAAKTGFGTEERMRRVFQRRLGITPRDYCARFASPIPVAPAGQA